MVLPILARIAGGAISRFGGAAAVRAATSAATRTAIPRLAKSVVTKVSARIPALTPITQQLRKSVGLAPVTRTLPVVTRPATALKAAVAKVAVSAIEKPFRTALPYVATAGMMGAVTRYGDKKAVGMAQRGAFVGTALTAPSIPTALTPSGLGLIGESRGVDRMGIGEALVPGAAPVVVRSWTTGTTDFAVDSTGKHWVLTKSGWKKYSPKKPIVLGTKHLTPKKFIQAAKKYYALKKDLDKVFKVVRKKK